MGRIVLARGGHLGANCHHPMSGAQLKAFSVPGTFSRALELGRAVAASPDPLDAAAQVLGAGRLFHGRVASLTEEERVGFYVTAVELQGTGADAGETAQLLIKNETMAFLRGGRPVVLFPDAVYLLEPSTGRGIMSVELAQGMELALMAAPAHPRLREAATATPRGRAAFSPTRYGRPDLHYRPLDELQA
jgi:DUF917 family protein